MAKSVEFNKELLPRDRVMKALNHQETDHVPTDFWAVEETWEKLFDYFDTKSKEDVLQALNIDIRQIQPKYIGKPLVKLEDGSYFDEMGIHRRIVKNDYCTYEEYASSPLAFVKKLEDFDKYSNWPKVENYDFAGYSDLIGDMHEKYYIKLETGGIFELAWALRGYEQFMIDMIVNPDIVHFIMNKITAFWCEFVKKAMESANDKVDMVYTYDDIGSQSSLLISKQMWNEFIKPYHQRLNDVIHSYNKTIMYHSCGAIYEMIDELINLKIDVLNPLQPRATGMDFYKIKSNYGNKLSFHGGIDIQNTLPKGTEDDVRKEVRSAINVLGEKGGYILSSAHYIQADTPVKNILAMYDEAIKMRQ